MPRWNTYPVKAGTPATTEHLILTDSDERVTIAAIGTALALSAGATNLTWTAGTSTVASDTGTDAVLTAVDASNDGLMTVAYRTLLLAAPTISSGADLPTSTPTKIGDIYIDTSTPSFYYANGTTSSADWLLVSATGSGSVTLYAEGTFADTVQQGDNSFAWPCPQSATLVSLEIWCTTAPVTASVIADLHKNGTTVFTTGPGTERPTIATSATRDVSGTPDVTTMAAGDLFQVQMDQINASDEGNLGQIGWRIAYTVTV